MKKYVDILLEQLPCDQETGTRIKDRIGERIQDDSVYYSYPYIFAGFFETVGEERMQKLSAASFFVYMYISLSDNFFDRKVYRERDLLDFELSMVCYDEAVILLRELFGDNSAFWNTWNERRRKYLHVNHYNHMQNGFSDETYCTLAAAKSEMGKLAIDTLYILSGSGDQHKYANLLQSHDYFSIGFQLLDDVEDFSRDLKSGTCVNFLVNRMVLQNIDLDNADEVGRAYFNTSLLDEATTLSIQYFDKARETTGLFPPAAAAPWHAAIEYKKRKICIFADEIRKYRAEGKTAIKDNK
jgi:squalene-hopene/tetraprenyl-beta-curcumene cyclase